MAEGDGEDGHGRQEEENENKEVEVWNYVMFVLAGWFVPYGKNDVVERAKEVFNLEELKGARAAFCDHSDMVGIENKTDENFSQTHWLSPPRGWYNGQ